MIVGIFLCLSNNLQHSAQQRSENLVAVFFLTEDLSEKNLNAIAGELKKSPLVKEANFVSNQDALKRFEEKFPELLEVIKNLEHNPLPASFEATLNESAASSELISKFIEKMKGYPGIDDAQYNKEWIERMYSFSRLAKTVGFFLGGILILASFFIVSNVIKLNVFARKDEIGILRLVGATNTFIRIPFLLEGMILGITGGILTLILLFFLIRFLPLYLGPTLGVLNEIINFRYLSLSQALSIIVSGGVIGFIGSISSLARFLRT